MAYRRGIQRNDRVNGVKKNKSFRGSSHHHVRVPSFSVGSVTPLEVQKWISISEARYNRNLRAMEADAAQRKELIRTRALELWAVHHTQIARAQTPADYHIAYTRFSDRVKRIFGNEAIPVLRELVENGAIHPRAKHGQFHTGFFKTSNEAIQFIYRNKGAVIAYLKKKYSIRSVDAANAITEDILPTLVEGMMRYDPKKGANPLTQLHWWIRAGMKARLAQHKPRALSLDFERHNPMDRKPLRLKDGLAAPTSQKEFPHALEAAHLANVMNQLDVRYAQIFALHLMGYSNEQIAGALPSPRHNKGGQPIGKSAVRMALKKINALVKASFERL